MVNRLDRLCRMQVPPADTSYFQSSSRRSIEVRYAQPTRIVSRHDLGSAVRLENVAPLLLGADSSK